MESSSRKYQEVYNHLMADFSSGAYGIGQRLPSERDVAAKLNVNMATVRRAFKVLVLAGIVEKRMGSGTYLKSTPGVSWESSPVNLVLDVGHNNYVANAIKRPLPEIAQHYGRTCRVVTTDQEGLEEHLNSFVKLGQPTILAMARDLPLLKPLAEAPGLFVSMAVQVHGGLIPCVVGDDNQLMQIIMEHLHQLGHQRIAYLHRKGGLAEVQRRTWKHLAGEDYRPEFCLSVPQPYIDVEQDIRDGYAAVGASFRAHPFTALICSSDPLMYGASAALRAIGVEIPRQVSLVSIGNSPWAEFAAPPVTSCVCQLPSHLEKCFQLLEHNHRHPERPWKRLLIPPTLIVRESSAQCRDTGL